MVQFTLSFDNVSVAAADEKETKEGFRGGANNNIVIKRGGGFITSIYLFIHEFNLLIK